MRIIHNENTENHLSVFKKYINQSENVFIAVAFFKKSGLDLIISEIEEALKKETKITIVCGLDFYQTEPEALKVIHFLSDEYDNCKLLIHNKRNITFHPKLFCFTNDTETHLIIGSANFTKGGLKNNFEVSLATNFDNGSKQYEELNSLINSIQRQSKKYNYEEIIEYEKEYKINKRNNKNAKKKSKDEVKAISKLNKKLLNEYLTKYRNNPDEQVGYELRTKNYKKAKEILEIIRTQDLNKDTFFEYYEQLVGKAPNTEEALWHSGKLFRGKNSVKEHYQKFKPLLNIIVENLNEKPQILLQKVENFYKNGSSDKIDSFGINKITEIFNTYKPEKFAVLNQNPLTSIKYLGFAEFPDAQSFKLENYRDFNTLISELMNKYKFETLGQVDHFLNFVYQDIKDNIKK